MEMTIRKITEKQYQYLKKLVYYTNYKKCNDLKKLTIIQASYLIKKLEKKLEKKGRKILIIKYIKKQISNATFNKFYYLELLKELKEK